MTRTRFTVSDGIQSGFELLRLGLRHGWAVLAVLAASYIVSDVLRNSPEPRQDLAMIAGLTGLPFYVMAVGALLRLSPLSSPHLRDEDIGRGGLQWRAVEWRQLVLLMWILVIMIAAWLAPRQLILPLIPVEFPIEIHLLSEAAAWAEFLRNDPDWFDYMAVTVEVLVDQLPAYCVMVAFSLAVAATAVTGRVQLLRALRLTRGYLFPLLIGVLAVTLPAVAVRVISIAMHAIFEDSLVPAIGWGLRFMEDIANTLATPLEVGFFAEAYRRITAKPQDVF